MNVSLARNPMERPVRLASDVSVACLSRDGFFDLGPEWDALASNALEENAYYAPRYSRALLRFIDGEREVRALAVRRGRRLIGLLPYVSQRWRWAGLQEVNVGWATPYTFSTTPLVDADFADEAVSALVDAMTEEGQRRRYWLLPDSNLDGPVLAALRNELRARNMPSTELNAFDRAVLHVGVDFEQHMRDHVSAKRRRELGRSRKRLAALGDLSYRSHASGPGLDRAIEDFLRVEATGWKGERGTALDCTENGRQFAFAAFGSGGPDPIGRADALYLGERAIAVSLAIQTGRTAFTVKCAYDETYRPQGAGLLLEEDVIRDVLTGKWADCLDSAAQPDHVIQSLWNGSIRVGDFMFSLGANASAEFERAIRYETSRQAIKKAIGRIA